MYCIGFLDMNYKEITEAQLNEWKQQAEERDWLPIRLLVGYYEQPETADKALLNYYLALGRKAKEPYCLYQEVTERASRFVPIRLDDADLSVLEYCAKNSYYPAADLLCTYVVEHGLHGWGHRAVEIAEAVLSADPLRKGALQTMGALLLDPGYGSYDRERGIHYLIQAGLNGCAKAGCEALAILYNDTLLTDTTPAYELMDALQSDCPDYIGFMRILFAQCGGRFGGFDEEMKAIAEDGGRYHALLGAYCNLFGIAQERNLQQARHYLDLAPELTELLGVYYQGHVSDMPDRNTYMAGLLDGLVAKGVRYAASTKASLLLGSDDDGAADKEEILRLIQQAQADGDPMGWGLMAYIHHYGCLGYAKDDEQATKESAYALNVGYCPLAMHVLIASGGETDRHYAELWFFRKYYMRVVDAVSPLKDELGFLYDLWREKNDLATFLSKEAPFGKRLLIESCFRSLV